MTGWLRDLFELFFPRTCGVCGRRLLPQERTMCLTCRHELPRTNLHSEDFSVIHERVAFTVPVSRGAAWFYYVKESPYVNLIHTAKYGGLYRLAASLGEEFAREIVDDGFFDGIDLLLPVPLHRLKLIKRGYNQSEWICRGIGKVTGLPVGDNLVAKGGHSTQTHLSAYERYLNTKDVYGVRDAAELDGLHVLVVDDVLTTGATLHACCQAIHDAAPSAEISVLTLGITLQQ